MGSRVETLTRPYPTLAQWLRANPHTEAIVRASSHFLHVRDGGIIEDNGVRKMRARVTHVVRRYE